VAGVVVLLLLSHQTISAAWTACDGVNADRAHAGNTAMTHGHHDASMGRPANAPAPKRESGCDHSVLADGCCMTAGCAIAVAGSQIVSPTLRRSRIFAIPAPAGLYFSLEIAPAVPPPRA